MATKNNQYYDYTDEIVKRAMELSIQEIVKKIRENVYADAIARKIVETLEPEIEQAIIVKIRDNNVCEWYNPNTGIYNKNAEKNMIESYKSCGKSPSERIGIYEGVSNEHFHKYLLFLVYGYEVLGKRNIFYSNRLRSLFSGNAYISKARLMIWNSFLNNDVTARYLASFILKNCTKTKSSSKKISANEKKEILISFRNSFSPVDVKFIVIDISLSQRKNLQEMRFKHHMAVIIRNEDGLNTLTKRDAHALFILLLLYKYYMKNGESVDPNEIWELSKIYVPDSPLCASDYGRVISKLKKELKIFNMSIEGKYKEGWKVFLPSGVDVFCNLDALRNFFEPSVIEHIRTQKS